MSNNCPNESRINRPQDKDDQKQYYSGKKKAHTVKNNVITHRGGKVVFLSDTYEGKKHDKAICDEEEYEFPPGSTLWQDTGFQGYRPEGVIRNREISSERVEVEHQIGGIKRCKIVVDKFGNRMAHYVDDVMETACGLHNFRLTHRRLATA